MPLARRRVLVMSAAATALGTLCGADAAVPMPVEIWKLRGCGCCTFWARHLEAEGFATREREVRDLAPIRAVLGIPEPLAGCHSARLDDLVIEGHVPA